MDGWVAFNGSCYLFGHDNVHFIEAEVSNAFLSYPIYPICLWISRLFLFNILYIKCECLLLVCESAGTR